MMLRCMIPDYPVTLESIHCKFQNNNPVLMIGKHMGNTISHTVRNHLPTEKVEHALNLFCNPRTWPDWNRNSRTMIATKAESLDKNDIVALHQVIKGSIIESRWVVQNIRAGNEFTEITLLGTGQSRNERPISSGLEDLKIIFTFLSAKDGGIEIHATCKVSGFLKIFSAQIKKYMEEYCNDFLVDLSNA